MKVSGARRIVICEDSGTHAKALGEFLDRDPGLEVVGDFRTAEAMLPELQRLDPDLITIDLEMPGMGGGRAVERIMRDHPTPILIVTGAGEGSQSVEVAEALAAGALEVVPKASLRLTDRDDVWAAAFRSRIKRLASVRLGTRARLRAATRTPDTPAVDTRAARAVGLGASTGGPPALSVVLGALPPDFSLPLLVVQHMAPGFRRGLVEWLQARVPPPVRLATHGARAEPGVWFAPDDAYLRLDASMRFTLDRDSHVGSHRPSLDVLLESIAGATGDGAVGVVLTGMGRDGAAGVEAVRGARGLVIAQDEATSAVFGMPRAAIEAGADVVLPLEEVGKALRSLRAAAVKP